MRPHPSGAIKNVIIAVYILLALGYFVPIAGLIGVIVAYVKRGDAELSWMYDHFTWLINTFWIALAIALAGVLTLYFAIGGLLLVGGFVWMLYRLVKGGLRLNEERSPYDARERW